MRPSDDDARVRACADDAVLSGTGDTEPALHAWIAALRATADAPAPAPTTALATLLRTGRPPVPAAVPTASRFPLRVRARRVVARAAALGVAGKLALGTGVAFASVGAVATVEAVPDSLQDPASAVVVSLVDALTLGTVELTPHGSGPAGAPLGGTVAPGEVGPVLPDPVASPQGAAEDGRTGSGVGAGSGARSGNGVGVGLGNGNGNGSSSVGLPGPRVPLPADRGNGTPPVTVPGIGVPGEGVPPETVPGTGDGTGPGKGNGLGNGNGLGAPAGTVPRGGLPQVTVPPEAAPGPPAHVPGTDGAVPGAGVGTGVGTGVGGTSGAGPAAGATGAGAGPGSGAPASDARPGQGHGRASP